MIRFCLLPFFLTVLLDWSPVLAKEESGAVGVRQPRGIIRRLLCRRHGTCGGEYGGYGGYQGGHQGGYPYPPINIGISQSQSSANSGGGGYNAGYYPNNYQYNGGGYGGYPGQGGPGGPGYFGHGQGGYNSQFNGNYYGGPGGGNGYNGYGGNGYSGYGGNGGYGGYGGYGFQGPQRPFGNGYYDESGDDGNRPAPEDDNAGNDIGNNNYEPGQENDAEAGSYAYAGRKNQ